MDTVYASKNPPENLKHGRRIDFLFTLSGATQNWQWPDTFLIKSKSSYLPNSCSIENFLYNRYADLMRR